MIEVTPQEAVLELEKHPTRIMRLDPTMDVDLRHWLLGKVLKRIRAFCERYDSDGDGLVLSRDVEKDFVKDGDREFLIIVGVRKLQIVGHLLANTYCYRGRLYVYVGQMELDTGSGITLEQERAAFEIIKNWRKELRADGIRAAAPTAMHIRRLQMLFGFTPFLTTMKWED